MSFRPSASAASAMARVVARRGAARHYARAPRAASSSAEQQQQEKQQEKQPEERSEQKGKSTFESQRPFADDGGEEAAAGGKGLARTVVALSALGTLGFLYFGRPFGTDDEKDKTLADAPQLYYSRASKRLNEIFTWVKEPSHHLPPPLPAPYQRHFTLVLGLEELLLYSSYDLQHGWKVAKRPGVDYFLAYMSQFYEIVIFTTLPGYVAAPLLERLDPLRASMFQLHREASKYINGRYEKDLVVLNRDLSKVLVIDSNPTLFAGDHKDNLITLKPWKGEAQDDNLLKLIPFLEALALAEVPDVRPILKSYGDSDHLIEGFAQKEKARIEEQKRKKETGFFSSLRTPQDDFGDVERRRKLLFEHFVREQERIEKATLEAARKHEEAIKEQMNQKTTVFQMMQNMFMGQPAINVNPPAPAADTAKSA